MKRQIKFVATVITLLIAMGTFSSQVLAQHHDHLTVGKKGMVRLSSKVRVGDRLLEPGMYHVQHVVEGTDHVFVFKPVTMPAGYKEYSMVEGSEIVRLQCRVEPVAKAVSNTKIVFGQNSAGERTIEEIQVAGEKVKHIFN
jgi:hypothetical protein